MGQGMNPHLRFHSLDFLRGVFALMVAGFHFNPPAPFAAGYMAVDFFFVLSGFVLTHRFGRTGISFRDFLIERVARLYPLAVLSMLAFLAVAALNGGTPFLALTPDAIWNYFSAFLLLSGIGFQRVELINYVTWSISVELFAGLVLFLRLQYPGWISTIAAIAAIVACYSNIFSVIGHLDMTMVYNPTFYTSFGMQRGVGGILMGNLLYALFTHTRRDGPVTLFHRLALTALEAGSIVVIAALIYAFNKTVADFAVLVMLCVMLVSLASGRSFNSAVLNNRRTGYFGALSYSVYLFQLPVIYLLFGGTFGRHVFELGNLPLVQRELAFMAILIGLSVLIHHYVERPLSVRFRRWLSATFAA